MSDRLTMDCPVCGRGTIRFTITDVANQRTVRCSRGCSVQLEDEGGGARRLNRELGRLDREIKKLSRTIRL